MFGVARGPPGIFRRGGWRSGEGRGERPIADMDQTEVRRRERSWGERLERLWRYRLLIPLKRNPHPPAHAAYGTMIGIAVALTPTVGVQMGMVVVIWLIARHVFHWHFSVVLGCAWTWMTNYITAPPMYYVFYVTGQLMLGRWDDLAGYHAFAEISRSFFSPPDLDAIDLAKFYITNVFLGWGVPMLVGCVPFVIIGGALGYWWCLRFVIRYRAARQQRRARRAERARSRATPAAEHDGV